MVVVDLPKDHKSRMDYLQAKCLILSLSLLYLFNAVNGEIILRIDPLALLSATLRTYQKATCDSDQVVIACPRGTSISIEFAQYNKFNAKDGITIEELCPLTNIGIGMDSREKAKHLLRGSIFGSPTQKVPANRYVSGGYGYALPNAASSTDVASSTSATSDAGSTTADIPNAERDDETPENCMWPNALQYSLLQTVVEACQKKKRCMFHGSPQFYGLGASGVGDTSGSSSYHSSTASSKAISVDPCPKRRKIVEVAYKCRPYEFRSKVACHNDVAQLECNPYSRIAVYSASFGRTEYESIQCPQPQGVREETCLASYATETVMQICHGRRRCNLAADANTFGSPCQPNSRMYLKVVYTCVPKLVLKENNESDVEPDETEDFENDTNNIWYDDEPNYKESEAIPKLSSNSTANAQRNNATVSSSNTGNASLTGNDNENNVNPVMTHSADLSLEGDHERLYLYLLIITSLSVLFCIAIVTARLVLNKRQNSNTDTSTKGAGHGGSASGSGLPDETTIPNGFNDNISEIDADIDMATAIPLPSVSKNENYVSYGPTSNLYGGLGPAGLTSPSGTTISAGTGVGVNGSSAAALIGNPLLVGARQSPDILGITSSSFAATSNAATVAGQGTVTGILTPAIVIGANSGGALNCGSSAISTMVPITSLAQYTTAPTIRAGYIINPEGVLQRPSNTPTPPIAAAPRSTNSPQLIQQQISGQGQSLTQTQPQPPQQQSPMQSMISPMGHLQATSTLRRSKPPGTQPMLQHQLSYDGTAPRTLSTGVPVSSQFYYG